MDIEEAYRRYREPMEKAMEKAKETGLVFSSEKLFTYEGLNETYGSLFNCPDRTLVSDRVKAALASKVKTGNGFMGDPAKMEELTGHGIKDLAGNSKKDDIGKTSLNLGTYILA